MEKQDLIEFTITTHALITVLQNALYNYELDGTDSRKKLDGIHALTRTIEQNMYNIKVSIDEI